MKPHTIEFRSTSDNTWVMRITADRKIEVNEDVDVTFAAQKVLDAMQGLLTPQRTWVGLDPEEQSEMWDKAEKRQAYQGVPALASLIQEVENKLKKKNT